MPFYIVSATLSTHGFESFIRQYGYPDKSGKPNRLNFGGRHVYGKLTGSTSLTLHIRGYEPSTHGVTDANGSVVLVDQALRIAASWSFTKLVEHWKTKHALAVYIPCCQRTNPDNSYSYHYGANIEIGTGTEFKYLLSGLANEFVYYDPGMKLEHITSATPVAKKRSQLRIKHKHLEVLYQNFEKLDISSV